MKLKRARLIAELTQQQLAERAGVDHSLISRLEKRKPAVGASYTKLCRIALALGHANPLELFPIELPKKGVAA